MTIFLRGHFDTASIPEQVRTQVQAVDPTLPVFGAQTLTQTVSDSLAQRRFSMEMITSFAATALLLATLGIYGVISYMVSECTREIGVRIALGAQRSDVVRLFLRDGMSFIIVGLPIGLAAAFALTRLLSSLLFGVKATDPLTFASAAVLLALVAFAACQIPARRALRVDPMTALRTE